jgi:putative Mg2+ transporter-C (MgtC) family protein
MAGIGFLGAGVIFKEGVNIQGLTTAASVYATAAIGLALGLGLYGPGFFATAAVLVSLTVLRQVEALLPSRVYGLAIFRFRAEAVLCRDALLALLKEEHADLDDMSFLMVEQGRIFEYRGNLSTNRRAGFAPLAERLKTLDGLVEFELLRVSK